MPRAERAGDQRVIAGKIAARYDSSVEAEVIGWFRQLLSLELQPGMHNMEKQLKNGISVLELAAKVQEGTPNCPEKARKMRLKPNTLSAPFKQMENIQIFLDFCEAYGLQKTSLFQTVDLYEGRNMAQFLACVQQLGSECQRNGFRGPSIGPKPTDRNIREWTTEQLRAGHNVIGLQAGTNKLASQAGMSMGSVRHVADIRADDMNKESSATVGLQMGWNKGASQAGMSMGSVRHVADIRADDMDKEGTSVIGLQMGSNKGASQTGMSFGAVRHVSDIKADNVSQMGSSVLGLQMGTNKGASQAGMSMGTQRHISDIKVDPLSAGAQSSVGLQMGYNQGANQAGMSMGGRRNVNN